MAKTTPPPTRGVPVTLDKERHLRFSLGTVRKMREHFGANVLAEGVEVHLLPELLHFGLVHEDPDLTVEAVEEMVDLEMLPELMKAVSKATGQEGKREAVQEQTPATEPALE